MMRIPGIVVNARRGRRTLIVRRAEVFGTFGMKARRLRVVSKYRRVSYMLVRHMNAPFTVG